MPYCAIMWCKKRSRVSNLTFDGVTFHRFPRTPISQEQWIAATGRPDTWFPTKNSSICSIHFEDSCFYQHGATRRLYETSVPTLNLPALVSTIEQERFDIKSENDEDTEEDDCEEPMSQEEEVESEEEIVEITEITNEIKPELNDHDYEFCERAISPKRLVKVVSLNQRNNVGKLQPLAPKLNSTTSIKGLRRIAPKILKLTSSKIISKLRLGPGTLVPVNLKPLSMPNKLNRSTLMGLPIKQANITMIPKLKVIAHKPLIRANAPVTASSAAQNNHSNIAIAPIPKPIAPKPLIRALNAPATLTLQASSSTQKNYSSITIEPKPTAHKPLISALNTPATIKLSNIAIAPKTTEQKLNSALNTPATVSSSTQVDPSNIGIAPKPLVTALNTPATISSSGQNNNSNIKVIASGSSQESVESNNKTTSISEVYRERVMKRKIDHLKNTLEKKCHTIKRLQNQNRLWRNKVKSLKMMLESLIKIKK